MYSPLPLAAHEIDIEGMSQNAIATRLPEMARMGIVKGELRKGEHYKEWSLVKKEASGQILLY